MVSPLHQSHPETKTLLRASLHRGGTNPRYKEIHDETRERRFRASQSCASELLESRKKVLTFDMPFLACKSGSKPADHVVVTN